MTVSYPQSETNPHPEGGKKRGFYECGLEGLTFAKKGTLKSEQLH